MNNTVRFVIALVCAAALAALATPQLSSQLPPGVAQVLAASLGAILHKMDAAQPEPPPEPKQ